MTKKILYEVKNDRIADKIIELKNSYVDNSNNVVINFTGKIGNSKVERDLHFSINIDTIINQYRQKEYKNFIADTLTKNNLLINSIYRSYNQDDYGIVVELKRSILQNGFKIPEAAKNINQFIRLPINQRDFRYNQLYDEKNPTINGKHFVFLYYAKRQIIDKKLTYDFIGFNIEPSDKHTYYKYFLLPITVIGDLVTLPFQVIYFAIEYFVVEVLNHGNLP